MQPALDRSPDPAVSYCDQFPVEPDDPGPNTGRGGAAGVGCVTRSTRPDAISPSFVTPSRVSAATAVATRATLAPAACAALVTAFFTAACRFGAFTSIL